MCLYRISLRVKEVVLGLETVVSLIVSKFIRLKERIRWTKNVCAVRLYKFVGNSFLRNERSTKF
jgi:hypothetical protein